MTNEQLYVLLEWIADGLEREIDGLRSSLGDIEGIEREPNFYDDKGEYRGRVRDNVFESEVEAYVERFGLEVRHDGDPVVLQGLLGLLRRIRGRAREL